MERVLEAACRELDTAEVAEEAVAAHGAFVRGRNDGLGAHPGLGVARSSRLAAARLLRELALPDVPPEVSRLPRGRSYPSYDRPS